MRLIDADALGVGRCSRDLLSADYCAGWNGLVSLIENAPTVDAVPVVRCEECKHYVERKEVRKCCCYVHLLTPHPMPADGFCSYGERRSDA